MTLSFHKVMFSVQEVLDIFEDCQDENVNFLDRFLDRAEERSRAPELQEHWISRELAQSSAEYNQLPECAKPIVVGPDENWISE